MAVKDQVGWAKSSVPIVNVESMGTLRTGSSPAHALPILQTNAGLVVSFDLYKTVLDKK